MKNKVIIIFIGIIVPISLLISGYSKNKSVQLSERDADAPLCVDRHFVPPCRTQLEC